jgi:hypothetical protein
MIYKTQNLKNLTVRQLRARRTRLAHELPDIESALRASLHSQTRRCGKQGCSCAGGEPHGPYVYLSVRTGRRRHLLYIPAGLAEGVRRMVDVTGRIETALTEISAINIELLSRGELN